MNLNEYRREIRQAHAEFSDHVEKAAAVLRERCLAADEAFLGDSDEARPADAEMMRRERL